MLHRRLINKIKSKLGLLSQTGYSPKIIIEIGVNSFCYLEAKEQIEQIAKILEAKNYDFLAQYPYKITIE